MTSAQDTFNRGSEGLQYEVDACPWPSRDGMLPRGLQYSLSIGLYRTLPSWRKRRTQGIMVTWLREVGPRV